MTRKQKQPDSELSDDYLVNDFLQSIRGTEIDWQCNRLKEFIHQREQKIYAELMEKIEPPKEWKHCLKVAFGQEEACALCGFSPEKLKTIINTLKGGKE